MDKKECRHETIFTLDTDPPHRTCTECGVIIGKVVLPSMTLTEQIINEFREKFPVTVETLPLSFQEYLMEKGQTGVLFDMEHHERVKRAEAKQRYFEDFLLSALTRVREATLEETEQIKEVLLTIEKVASINNENGDDKVLTKIYTIAHPYAGHCKNPHEDWKSEAKIIKEELKDY